MRDPYDILGVSKNASAAEVKSAFRRQAKKLHPDANKHDPKAATRFAELNAAYEILGEADKRKAFDRGGQDITAALTITLAEAATGTHKRVHLPTGKEVDVKIPAGLNDGQTIRLKGQGLAGSGGSAGDLLIVVSVAPHPVFAREGAD